MDFELRRLDLEDTRDLDAGSAYLREWIERVDISRDPPMPEQLGDRPKDLWRPLIAIADASGGDWGERARAAALALTGSDLEQDLGVVLLDHIRVVFDRLAVDRIPSKILVAELLALDIADGLWQECPREGGPPRKLTDRMLAAMLRPFSIAPRTMWPLLRQPGDQGSRGYLRRAVRGCLGGLLRRGAGNATPRQMLRLVVRPRYGLTVTPSQCRSDRARRIRGCDSVADRGCWSEARAVAGSARPRYHDGPGRPPNR